MTVPTKLVFTGSVGAGKSTAIGSVSQIAPIRTEVQMYEAMSEEKTTTTVGMDYGEVTLPEGKKIRIFGTPGQRHFDFMCKTLGRSAQGCVILLDHRHPDVMGELRYYSTLFANVPQVAGITHGEGMTAGELASYAEAIGGEIPVLAVDARVSADILQLMRMLPCV